MPPPDLCDIRQDSPSRKPRRRCTIGRARRHDYADMLEPLPGETPSGRISAAPPAPTTLVEHVRQVIADDEDAAIDLIYTTIDAHLRAGQFATVDGVLSAVPLDLPIVHLLAFVSISRAARDELSSWRPFVRRVRDHLTEVAPERVDRLLAHLER